MNARPIEAGATQAWLELECDLEVPHATPDRPGLEENSTQKLVRIGECGRAPQDLEQLAHGACRIGHVHAHGGQGDARFDAFGSDGNRSFGSFHRPIADAVSAEEPQTALRLRIQR